jgi:acetyltransferase-like isoleucine patch superfamily enzyme
VTSLPRRISASIRFRATRWRRERAGARRLAGFGSVGRSVHVSSDAVITAAERIEVGDNVHIGTGAFIRAEGGLRIGSNTHISRNVLIYTYNHDIEGEALPYDAAKVLRPVEIGRDVWIGMNVCIAPGTSIGDGAVVGMGTVVSGEVPALAIIASQKWRQVGTRDEAHYRDLVARGRVRGPGGRLIDRE